MNSQTLFKQLAQAIVLLLLQIFLLRHISLFGWAYCYGYVGLVLLMPIEFNPAIVMLVGLGSGLITDSFADTAGIHAAATVLIAYLRKFSLNVLSPGGGYESFMEVSAPVMGLGWYLQFMVPLIFIHHVALLLLEYLSLSAVPLAMLKAVGSTLLTLIVVMMVQFGVAGKRNR